jgi:hypothetical protein
MLWISMISGSPGRFRPQRGRASALTECLELLLVAELGQAKHFGYLGE